MKRRDRLYSLAVDIHRSEYFIGRTAGRLSELDRADLAGELLQAALQLSEVRLKLVKLCGQAGGAAAAEYRPGGLDQPQLPL